MTSTPLRVLAICGEDPEYILGGMGMHVRELYRHLAARDDVEVDLLTGQAVRGTKFEPDGSVDYLGFKKWHAHDVTCWKPRSAGFECLREADFLMAMTLGRLIASGRRWDVIHMHEWGSVQLGRFARHALDVPLIGTMHLCITHLTQLESPEWFRSIKDWSAADLYMTQQEGNLIQDPDETILCSNAYVEIVREKFLTERPIHMIHNGIDPVIWRPGPLYECDFSELTGERPMALYVGRIATMKGIVPLLDAIESDDSGWMVVLAGEVNANTHEDKERWEVTRRIRKIESEHPERLRWVGFQHGDSLRKFYQSADCVLMPSTHEPFGIVALEAMAMGTPLVATSVDGLGEIVIDEEGVEYALVIPDNSPAAIVEALGMMRRPEVREELREAGLRRAQDFSWNVAADKTLAVYQQAMGG